jgi:hypothetical protein
MATIDHNTTPWDRIGSGKYLRLQDSINRAVGSRSVDRNHNRMGAMPQDPVWIVRRDHDESPLPCLCSKGIGQSQTLSRVLMSQWLVKQ